MNWKYPNPRANNRKMIAATHPADRQKEKTARRDTTNAMTLNMNNVIVAPSWAFESVKSLANQPNRPKPAREAPIN